MQAGTVIHAMVDCVHIHEPICRSDDDASYVFVYLTTKVTMCSRSQSIVTRSIGASPPSHGFIYKLNDNNTRRDNDGNDGKCFAMLFSPNNSMYISMYEDEGREKLEMHCANIKTLVGL